MPVSLAGDEQNISVDYSFSYAKILFYSRLPVTEYRDTVQYVNYPSEYILLRSCGQFCFGISEAVKGQIYIIPADAADTFGGAEEWQVEQFGDIAVVSSREQ